MCRLSMRAFTLVMVAALIGVIPALVEAAGLTVELDLEPSSEAAGLYEVTAQIQDAESGEMLSVPTVVFPKGEDPARVTSSTQSGGIWSSPFRSALTRPPSPTLSSVRKAAMSLHRRKRRFDWHLKVSKPSKNCQELL